MLQRMSTLDANDPYAKRLAEWREVKLPEWQREFDSWDRSRRLRPPPMPTTGKCWLGGRNQTEAEAALRDAAHRMACAERAHEREEPSSLTAVRGQGPGTHTHSDRHDRLMIGPRGGPPL